MKIYLGTQNSDLITRVGAAYEKGCNSLFTVGSSSWHDNVTDFYALRRTTGRRVNNPAAWLKKAVETANKQAAMYYKAVAK